MYNEEKGAARCIDSVISVIEKQKIQVTLILVNDGSADATKAILEKKQKQYKKYLSLVSYSKNKGYGGALREGVERAKSLGCTYVLFMDSDLTNDPFFIPTFMKHMSYNVDCVKASRYMPGGKVIGVPFTRFIISRIGNYIASYLFHIGIRDCTNGFRMVRLDKLKNIVYKETNFSIILEELYMLKKQHATFKEIPTTLTTRKNSFSHFSYKPGILYDYLKYTVKSLLV